MSETTSPHLIRSAEIDALPERHHVHQFNERAVRMTRTLGAALGLERIGLHLIRLPPGQDSTQLHSHSDHAAGLIGTISTKSADAST